jgi:hypothetical protein
VPIQESERPCICVLGVTVLSISTIFVLDLGTCRIFFFFILLKYEVSNWSQLLYIKRSTNIYGPSQFNFSTTIIPTEELFREAKR